MARATIVLVRHGETDWNRDHRVQGHTDVPLNEEGRRQAHALSALLDGHVFDAVYSSDLSRALETATILAEPRSLDVRTLASLREKNFGTWEGLSDVDVHERFGDPGPGGWGDAETTHEMAGRTVAALLGIGAAHNGKAVLVITHGGPMRAALHHCGVEDGRVGNCELVRVVVAGGVLRAEGAGSG